MNTVLAILPAELYAYNATPEGRLKGTGWTVDQ